MTQGRLGLVLEGYEVASDAAKRLGVTQKQIAHMARRGQIPGARQVNVGRGYWYVPKGCVVSRNPRWREGAFARPLRHASRCDCCGILLARSGDDKHANDAPDAVRCWSCRQRYGLGVVAPEVMGEYAQELEEVMQ